MDYLLSPRGQVVLVGNGDFASPLPNIEGSLNPEFYSHYDLARYPAEVVNVYRSKWDAIFKKK